MAKPHIIFYPVGNGDMTLIETESGRKIVIDTNIRDAADDPNDPTPDVAKKLKERLNRDAEGRPYVDVLLLSHPDQDHCNGMDKHFHLGPLDKYPKKGDKIVVREIWSSPIVFRRASRKHTLTADAKAFQKEAIRRVELFRKERTAGDGDRVRILGEDIDGKTDDILEIVVKIDSVTNQVNGTADDTISMRLLGPLPAGDEDDEEQLSKNHSSTIIQFTLAAGNESDACRYLTGGDAEVAIWERLWQKHKNHTARLSYDLMLTPHHCSWHTLSYDSWSELRDDGEVSADAKSALSQARSGANVIASSFPIDDDDDDPPCFGAKREYVAITKAAKGEFRCVGEHPKATAPAVMEFEITENGPRLKATRSSVDVVGGGGAVGTRPLRHG
ncbi:MAG: metallohydrolase [Acidobacteriota bacterium]|nr:metallohydrolase [Acidobacteriota bacterium]